MPPYTDLLGKRFGMLTVVEDRGASAKHKAHTWLCKCDCGKTSIVPTGSLTSGRTKTCGCNQGRRLPPGVAGWKVYLKSHRQSAKKRGHVDHLTDAQISALSQGNCHYCNATPSMVKVTSSQHATPDAIQASRFVHNGIDRIDAFKGYIEGNVVSCCKICNIAKHTRGRAGFLAWIEQVYNHSIRKETK
jgi:hypothetical protein